MKTKIILVFLGIFLVIGITSLTFCTGNKETKEKSNIEYYTCPMHPQIHEEKPGECPICHMKLVPVYKEGKEEQAEGKKHTRGLTISTLRQQLIGIRTEEARMQSVSKKIRTVGRVAYDPELAIAQQEYLQVIRSSPLLKESAATRLKLLGMSDDEITSLERRKKDVRNLYLPQSNDSYWIYATLYQEDIPLVKIGTKAMIFLDETSNNEIDGVVRSIDRTIDPMTRSVRARVEIKHTEELLKPDMFVTVYLIIPLGDRIVIPKSAVLTTGKRSLAFIVSDETHFEPREISLGETLEDTFIVEKGIKKGERVVSYGTFLVDSESELKSAISGSLECPSGQTWDQGMSMCMPGEKTEGGGYDHQNH